MATTPKRALPLLAGSDLASTIDDTVDAALTILDDATFYTTDTFTNRPAADAAKTGRIFVPTDLPGLVYLSDGTNWIEVSPDMGSVPIGHIGSYVGSSDPGDTRFVKCDVRALSTTTYATLFAHRHHVQHDGRPSRGAWLALSW